MTQLSEHPSVQRFRDRAAASVTGPPPTLDAQELRDLCLAAGADDVGFVDVDRSELADQRQDILSFFPHTKSLISFVLRITASRFTIPPARSRMLNSTKRASA